MNAAFLDQIKELFSTADIFFVEANNIDVAFIVLANGKNVSVIEQIIKLSAVNFIESDKDFL